METLRSHLKNKTHVLWDWNGTILDDAHLCVEILAKFLTSKELSPIDVQQYRDKFRFPVRDFYTDGLGICMSEEEFLEVSRIFISTYNERFSTCKLFPGTKEFIQDLNQSGIKNSILSASFEPDLIKVLSHFDLMSEFVHTAGIGDSLAKSKVDRGKSLLNQLKEPKEELILIGDTAHDFEVASELGIDCILIAEGHNALDRLESLDCPTLPHRFH